MTTSTPSKHGVQFKVFMIHTGFGSHFVERLIHLIDTARCEENLMP